MESVTAIGAMAATQQGYLNLEWNGTHYRVPVFSSTTEAGLSAGVSTKSYGSFFMTNNVSSQSVNASTPEILNTGTFVSGALVNFTRATTRLTYTGAMTQMFSVTCQLANFTPSNSQQTIAIYKNGSLTNSGEMQFKNLGSGPDESAAPVSVTRDVELAQNDFIEFFIEANNTILITYRSVAVIIHQID